MERRRRVRILQLGLQGWTGQGLEIPEGCEHLRTGRRKMRTGHPDPHLRRHRNLAGDHPAAPKGRRKERPKPRMRSPHPHWQRRPHRKDHPQPCEHHGGARTADRQSHSNRCRAHRTILPSGRPLLPRPAEPREADHHAQAGRHLVRRQRFQLGKPECPLQFKSVPHAEPPCHLYKRDH